MTYTKADPESIREMFGSIAKRYDRTNAVLSFCMHHYWNSRLVHHVAKARPKRLLDLCAGTGEIALGAQKKMPELAVTLLDFCPEMLDFARIKAEREGLSGLSFIEGNAESLPFADESFDACSVAYGIRNVQRPEACFKEVLRTLTPGGLFGILELTRPKNRLLRFNHSLYLRWILPLLGKLSTSNEEAYRYLCRSIESFVDPDEMQKTLKNVGFSSVRSVPLFGGVATVVLANK